MNKVDYILVALMCLLLAWTIVNQYEIQRTIKRESDLMFQLEYRSRYDIFESSEEITKLLGIYFDSRYYCVWTANRTSEQIMATDVHEQCHDLISKKRAHFCKVEGNN
jgi:hypothetical protein